MFINVYIHQGKHTYTKSTPFSGSAKTIYYQLATILRHLKITGLFCKRAL